MSGERRELARAWVRPSGRGVNDYALEAMFACMWPVLADLAR